MAKKNIISDFGSLKRMVTFSEEEPISVIKAQKVSKETAKASCTPSVTKTENSLHVGQSVILMDSDFRGKIVSIGKIVKIELEEGLEIEAAYGEFAVIDSSERTKLRQTTVKSGKRPNTRKPYKVAPNPDGTLTVDLHIEAIPGGRKIPKGQHLQFQIDTFRRIIRSNLSHRGMKITFIHGIGDGILKAAIRKELDEVLALHCSYTVGDPAMTTVIIR